MAFASRTLNKAETRYSTTEKELLAIVWATKHFRQYLYGRKFSTVTDHKPLVWLMNVKDPNSRLMRWRLKLEEYDYEIIYKSGKTNTNADALSRIPINAIDSYMSDEDARRILADILKPEIKIAFHKNPYTGWKNIDPESVSIENLYALILPILEDPNASPTKWTLHFVGPINDEIRRTINDLINIYNLQTKTKIIIEERPTDWFEEIPASVTKEDVPRNPSPIPSLSSRPRPIRNKEIITKNQVGR